MRVAILTVHRAPNCGAMLQAWALKTALERLGHHVSFPDCNHIDCRDRKVPYANAEGLSPLKAIRSTWKNFLRNLGSRDIFLPAMARFDAFRSAHLPELETVPSEFPQHYDAVVLGSDQIWNAAIMKGDTALFLGETVPDGLRLVSYAASFGDHPPTGPDAERLYRAARRMSALGVRERTAFDFFSVPGEFSPVVTLDPTLLIEEDAYVPLRTPCHPDTPYLYVYSLFYSREMWERTKAVAAALGLTPVYTPLHQYTRYRMPKGLSYGVSPDRFLDLIAHADCVMTDSFHGTALSVLHRKRFATICHSPSVGKSRQGALLGDLGLGNRLFTDASPLGDILRTLQRPFEDEALTRLGEKRLASLEWLENALSGR